jgi:hypothetical protein
VRGKQHPEQLFNKTFIKTQKDKIVLSKQEVLHKTYLGF